MLRGVGYTPDASRLVSFGRDDAIKTWDLRRPRLTPSLQGLQRRTRQIEFLEGGDVVAIDRSGRTFRWRRDTGEIVHRVYPGGRGVLIEGGTRLVLFRSTRGVTAYELRVGEKRELHLGRLGERFRPTALTATSLGDRVVLGESTGRVSVWPTDRPGPSVHWTPTPGKGIMALAVHPDGKRLAVGPLVGAVRLFRLEDGGEIATLRGGGTLPRSLAFHPDGRTLAVGDEKGPVLLVDVATGERRVELRGHGQMVLGLAWSPDATRLASASLDGTVRVWDAERGVLLLVLRGHPIHATAVAWSPDGTALASGGGDHGLDVCTVRLWEAPDHR
jgi:WD40 repeat protein